MGLIDTIRQRLLSWLMPDEWMDNSTRERLEAYGLRQNYYYGGYRKQLTVRPLQADDNLGVNFTGLIVDRSISMLIGQGIDFDLGENEAAEQYLAEVYRANSDNVLLHKACQNAAVFGTGFIKIIPDGTEMRGTSDTKLPRLVPIDPTWITIETMPEDIDTVRAYIIRYNVSVDGKDEARKETTERQVNEAGETVNWLITSMVSNSRTSARWEIVNQEIWPYEFPPIVHWQNLPRADDVYGQSDVANVLELQDRVNFIASNISKIIRYHAHPKTWGRNAGNSTKAAWGADEMLLFPGPDATIQNLEMQSDLASSQSFLLTLRQAMFDISRTVDMTSMADKLGSLTNFGLRVLFIDALNKLRTKQELLGEALIELHHRLLTLAGIAHDDGGRIIWHEALPVNDTEQVAGLQADLSMGIVSKPTVAKKRGYDYEQEAELIREDKSGEENLGSMLLQAFNKGQ